jgi:multimeric flavodoxin WrbA/nitrite reductase/ring-hydroxylating ferredoxin subunit
MADASDNVTDGWVDLGTADELARKPLQQLMLDGHRLALSYRDGTFGAVSGTCNHFGGPLGQGTLDGDYIVCPWHYWKFHRSTGLGEPGYEGDAVPSHRVKVENGRVLVERTAASKRSRLPHPPHPVARPPQRAPGPIRVVGLSTTVMSPQHPRYSTSEALLDVALEHAQAAGHEIRSIRLRELKFRACEGFYSKSAYACTWPCSITQMDPDDQLDRVYEALVHWGDVFLIATPIRWGNASALYYKMIERMNCIQNQVTIANKVLLKNKVVGAIITGGQDNVQGVAGQMLGFFSELGCQFPQFPYIAHTRGWSAEDMENNVATVQASEELRTAARQLCHRSVELAERLLTSEFMMPSRAGRKGNPLETER